MLAQQRSVAELVHLIRSEYLEMPGLKLTPTQARRLWNVDEDSCKAIFEDLVDLRFLDRTGAVYTRRPQ